MKLHDYKIFLDDEREPGDWFKDDPTVVVVRDYWEFKKLLDERGIPKYITFDHDLGHPTDDGKKCAEYLVMTILRNTPEDMKDFQYEVHSQNPVGAANIRNYLDRWMQDLAR